MGFQVKYEEITSIRELILAQLDRWIEQIDAVRSSIVEIAAMSEMHGEAAEHVRSYMWDYHMNLANMIKDMQIFCKFSFFSLKFQPTIFGYYTILCPSRKEKLHDKL